MTTAGLARRRLAPMAHPGAPFTRWLRILLAVAIVAAAMAGVIVRA